MSAPGLAVLRHCGAEGHVEGEKKTDKKLPFNALPRKYGYNSIY